MANDNTVELGGTYPCVVDQLRDTERDQVADPYPRMSPMLDSINFQAANFQDEVTYVNNQLNAPGAPWKGIGEVHLRSKAYNLGIHADDGKWIDICKEAINADVPVFIHWDPRYDPVGGEGAVLFQQTINELWRLFQDQQIANTSLKVVWFHHYHHWCTGPNECLEVNGPQKSCNAGDLAPCVKELLLAYPPNVPGGGGPVHPELYLGWEIKDVDDFLNPTTRQLTDLGDSLLTFSTQIVIGSDIGLEDPDSLTGSCDLASPPPSWDFFIEEPKTGPRFYLVQLICNTRQVLGVIAQTDLMAAENVAFRNAQRILGIP